MRARDEIQPPIYDLKKIYKKKFYFLLNVNNFINGNINKTALETVSIKSELEIKPSFHFMWKKKKFT